MNNIIRAGLFFISISILHFMYAISNEVCGKKLFTGNLMGGSSRFGNPTMPCTEWQIIDFFVGNRWLGDGFWPYATWAGIVLLIYGYIQIQRKPDEKSN